MSLSRKSTKMEYLLIKGYFENQTLVPLGLLTNWPSFYEQEPLKHIVVTGKSKEGKLIFNQFPYEISKEAFIAAVPYSSQLESVEVKIEDKLFAILNKSKKATIELNYEITKEGVNLQYWGAYDRLDIIAYDTQSESLTHLHLDDEPSETEKEIVLIPWEKFPVTDKVYVEGIAMRGLDVAKTQIEEIFVEVQPTQLRVYCTGYRKIAEAAINENMINADKTEEEIPTYEFIFVVKGYLHGVPLPESAYTWKIDNQTYRGKYLRFQPKNKERFSLEVQAIDQLKRVTSHIKEFAPLEIVNELEDKLYSSSHQS